MATTASALLVTPSAAQLDVPPTVVTPTGDLWSQVPGSAQPPGAGGRFGANAPDGSGLGVFAADVLGATPKYALNQGDRRDTQHRNSLARLLIRVDADEQALFEASVGDAHVRANLLPAIASEPGATAARFKGPGYLDFLLEQVQMPLQENMQVVPTLSDNYVAYFFGQAPPTWTFSGRLINTNQDDQASNFLRLYLELLRGTQMARRQKVVSLRFDSYVVAGVLCSYAPALASANELLVPFTFQLLVKRLYFTKCSQGWRPTSAGGAFVADINAIAYDGRPRGAARIAAYVGAIDPGEEVTPTPQNQADPRTAYGPPPPNNGVGADDPGPVSASGVAPATTNGNQMVASQPAPASGAAVVAAASRSPADQPAPAPETISPAVAATGQPNPDVSANSDVSGVAPVDASVP